MSGAAWEARFRVPFATFPHWSAAAPERLVYVSDASGVLQAYAWDRAEGTHRRASAEPVGVVLAEVTHDGSEIVWFSDDTGDESGVASRCRERHVPPVTVTDQHGAPAGEQSVLRGEDQRDDVVEGQRRRGAPAGLGGVGQVIAVVVPGVVGHHDVATQPPAW